MKNSSEQPGPESSELEFPDWSGMVDTGQMVSPATAFRLVGHYYKWLPNKEEILKERAAQRCEVEFVL